MNTDKNIILLGNPDTKIFLLKDPLLETKIEKDSDNHIKLELEYPFKTPLLFAFCFRIEEVRLPYQEGFYINEDLHQKKQIIVKV